MSFSPPRMLGWDENRDRADMLVYTKHYGAGLVRRQSPKKATAEDELIYGRFELVACRARFRMAITSAKVPSSDTITLCTIQPLEYLRSSETIRPVKVAVRVGAAPKENWGPDEGCPIFIHTGGGWIKDWDFIHKLAERQHCRTIEAAKVFTGLRDINDAREAERLMNLEMYSRIGRKRLATTKPIKKWEDVPNELRSMIYEFALGPVERLYPYKYFGTPPRVRPRWTDSICEGPRVRTMFHLCKDVTVELHKYMYGKGNFCFCMRTLSRFLMEMPEPTLQLIRRMELEFDPEPMLNFFGGPHMWNDHRARESYTIDTFRRFTALRLEHLTIRIPHPGRLNATGAPMRYGCHFRIALMIVKVVKEATSQLPTPPQVTFETYGEFTAEQMAKLKDVETCPEDNTFPELAGVSVDVDGAMPQ